MTRTLDALVAKLNPRQTALLLGAGSSIPSGAPSGAALATALGARGRIQNAERYSLAEVCGLFEAAHGREALASAVRDALGDLQPTGGLRLLPKFDWYRIYSTNFDTLVETVYRDAGVPLAVRRSNFDFSRTPEPFVLEYYKIHGCLTEDFGFGHRSRMLLTEDDYDTYDNFRQASFRALGADILTKDFLVIGQSLDDAHLKDLVREALRAQAQAGTTGRVFILSFDRDEGLASLQEARGAEVYFGDLDSLFAELMEQLPDEEIRDDTTDFESSLLPAELVSVTTDVRHAVGLAVNAKAMFNGSPASYADIAGGLTFARTMHVTVMRGLRERPIAVLLGAGGVGKTTLARQIVTEWAQATDGAWEHNSAFAFSADQWIAYEVGLRESGKTAILLVDDCVDQLGPVGRLAEHLGRTTDPALRLVLTANTGRWKQRTKSNYVFTHGNAHTLSKLTNDDIGALLSLTGAKREIRELVDTEFLKLPRGEQTRILRERCSADMYVCMKNIFAAEELDFILLREFAELELSEQDVYRSVSALQSLGARVHRQLVLRLLGLEAGQLAGILEGLTGVVHEFDIKPRDGLYGWETRHREIATTIARYKYAQQDELESLFERLIDAINPSVRLEVETARSLCAEPFGIDRLVDRERQVDLLRRVTKLLPGESVPRHRLIRHLIDQDRLEEATAEHRDAVAALRPNPVLARYEVLLLARKAELTIGLMDEDRVALLLDAHGKAVLAARRYSDDMQSFRMLGEVSVKLAERGAGTSYLDQAIEDSHVAAARILDPDFGDIVGRLESDRRRLAPTAATVD